MKTSIIYGNCGCLRTSYTQFKKRKAAITAHKSTASKTA